MKLQHTITMELTQQTKNYKNSHLRSASLKANAE